ncbi:hypothetical protein AF72_12805 [Xylella taiwanensis]|uniref:Uncharacterized protein n=1 Tax=Xylella taiwanensis TaxID=1444770 RepID=Z9JFX8_9GAMM|nr:hypothetical protein AF72_12805 [Xylella taiwanensis]
MLFQVLRDRELIVRSQLQQGLKVAEQLCRIQILLRWSEGQSFRRVSIAFGVRDGYGSVSADAA